MWIWGGNGAWKEVGRREAGKSEGRARAGRWGRGSGGESGTF